jgi:hypothetical protein
MVYLPFCHMIFLCYLNGTCSCRLFYIDIPLSYVFSSNKGNAYVQLKNARNYNSNKSLKFIKNTGRNHDASHSTLLNRIRQQYKCTKPFDQVVPKLPYHLHVAVKWMGIASTTQRIFPRAHYCTGLINERADYRYGLTYGCDIRKFEI